VRILLWHVHGSWTTAFVQGDHTYVVPTLPDRGPDGRGRAQTWSWPPSVVERTPEQLRDEPLDLVVLQRDRDEELCRQWTGRRPGRDLPAIWLEHNAPQGRVNDMRHPAADRDDLHVVHVTATNDLFWDCGSTPTTVIDHGIVDPGHRYTGELAHAAVVVNEPVRRGRVVGTDLLPQFAAAAPLDVFGMGTPALRDRSIVAHDDIPQAGLHVELARRRLYLHPFRWTSLGLALIEAMQLGMPVVALATLEVPEAVPPDAGVVSNRRDVLVGGIRRFVHDPDDAEEHGLAARRWALERYGLARFLDDWDRLIKEVTA